MLKSPENFGDSNQGAAVCSLTVSIVTFTEERAELIVTISSLVSSLLRAHKDGFIDKSKILLINNMKDVEFELSFFNELLLELDGVECDMEIIQGHENIGYGSGHNLGLNHELGGFYLFMNPDVEIEEAALSAGLSYLIEHTEVGMVSPHTQGRDGEQQFLCKQYPSVFDLFLRGFMPESTRRFFAERLDKYELRMLSETEPTIRIPVIGGCFMLCRSSVLAEIGGFDSRYFLYFEDFDLSLRLGAVADIAYLPKMRIKHLGGQASSKGLWHILMFIRSGFRFFSTHGWRWF